MAEYRDHIDQASFEQIESYLLGTMDTPTRQAFEQAMANDALLRNEVDLQRKLIATLEVGSFMAEQSPATTAAQPTAPVRSLTRRWYYAAAAVFIIAAGTTWYLLRPADTQQLYTKYFHADPGLPVTMGSSDSASYVFYDAMVTYKEGNYDKAATQWEQLGRQSAFSDTLQYYIGIARLNNNQLPESRQYLEPVATNANSLFKDQAAWYLALSYVRSGDLTAAIRWLQQIPNDEQAKQLLAEPALKQKP